MRLQIFSNELIYKTDFLRYIEDWRNEIPAHPQEDYEAGIKQRLSWNNPELSCVSE